METQPLVDILGAAVPRPPPKPDASPGTTSNEKREKFQSLKGHREKTEVMPGSSPASPGTWIDPKKTLKKADAFTESENEAWKIIVKNPTNATSFLSMVLISFGFSLC